MLPLCHTSSTSVRALLNPWRAASIALIAVCTVMVFGGTDQAQAATFTVNTPYDYTVAADGVCDDAPAPYAGQCGLREAVVESVANGLGADTITLPSPAPAAPYYMLSEGALASNGNLTINGPATARGATIFQASYGYAIFNLAGSSAVLSLSNLTLRSTAPPAGQESQAPALGGAISMSNSATLNLMGGVEIAGNDTVQGGGAIGASNGSVVNLGAGNMIRDNTAAQGGGVSLDASTLNNTGTIFYGNRATATAGTGGGAIYAANGSTVNIDFPDTGYGQQSPSASDGIGTAYGCASNSRQGGFCNNVAAFRGGAIFADASTVTVKDVIFEYNKTDIGFGDYGGAIYLNNVNSATIDRIRAIGNTTNNRQAGFLYTGGTTNATVRNASIVGGGIAQGGQAH